MSENAHASCSTYSPAAPKADQSIYQTHSSIRTGIFKAQSRTISKKFVASTATNCEIIPATSVLPREQSPCLLIVTSCPEGYYRLKWVRYGERNNARVATWCLDTPVPPPDKKFRLNIPDKLSIAASRHFPTAPPGDPAPPGIGFRRAWGICAATSLDSLSGSASAAHRQHPGPAGEQSQCSRFGYDRIANAAELSGSVGLEVVERSAGNRQGQVYVQQRP